MAMIEEHATPAQKRGIRITLLVLLAFVFTVMALFLNRFNQPRVLSDVEMRSNGAYMFDTPRSFKAFQLIDHNNQPFTPADLEGKWTWMFFAFTNCPDICPTTLAVMSNAYEQLQPGIKDDTQVVMVTVDPARDTPEKLAEYIPYFNAEFLGVTGGLLEITNLATQLNIPFEIINPQGRDNYTVDHSGNVVLINPRGHFHGFFKAPIDAQRLRLTFQSEVTQSDL